MRRFIVEFGMGIDFHGQDVTKAAKKAAKDAVSHGCLTGLTEVLNIGDLRHGIEVKVTIAASCPDKVDSQAVAEVIPIGNVTVVKEKGGLSVPGLYIPEFGDSDESIEVALAVVEVIIPES